MIKMMQKTSTIEGGGTDLEGGGITESSSGRGGREERERVEGGGITESS